MFRKLCKKSVFDLSNYNRCNSYRLRQKLF